MPSLFRRRQVWLPTAWGVLVLFAIAAALVVLLARGAAFWLAPTEPAARDGGARTLVVEGWLDDDALDDAIPLVRRGRYERIVTSGGPIETWRETQPWPSYAERAADHLRRRGVEPARVVAVPAPAMTQDRSYLSAVVVREWARRQGLALSALDVYSVGVHARRSQMVYRMAFGPDVDVGIVAAPPHGYSLERWWSTSEGAKAVVGELLSIAWTKCCFWPPRSGDDGRGSVPDRSP